MKQTKKPNLSSVNIDRTDPIRVSYARLRKLGIKVFLLNPQKANPNAGDIRLRLADPQRDADLLSRIS